MKGACATLTTVFLSAAVFSGIVTWLNVSAGLLPLSLAVLFYAMIGGATLAAGATGLTALFRRGGSVVCFGLSMGFVGMLAFAALNGFDLSREILIGCGALGFVSLLSGLVGSGVTRLFAGK